MSEIARNLGIILDQIDAAMVRSGRKPGDVRLVAVSKTHPPEAVQDAYDAGQIIFGENRVQEAETKIEALSGLDAEWHLIGHLQTNKIKKALTHFHWIHSVDSVKLLKAMEQECQRLDCETSILLQLNLAQEASKFGAEEKELEALLAALSLSPHLHGRGLMIIPPYEENPETVRPYFRRLSELGERYGNDLIERNGRLELSMGMSHDFSVAIEEGATLVRIGTAIFGSRTAA